MGNLWARFRHRDVRIILLGLDSAGKTTILYRLKLDDLVTTIPTIGFNVESIQYKDMHLTAWDIGSRDKIRPLFRHYYKGADAVVFVIDSHDRERLDELNYDVIKPAISAEELTNAVFLFLANKVDLPDTMSTEEISEKLGLRFLKHPWGILPVSAVSGEGLQSALEWLAVRLGSAQVKARNFTASQPQQAKLLQQCRTASSLSSSSSPATSNCRGTSSQTPTPQKPVILVNSRLVKENRGMAQSGSSENTQTAPVLSPGSSYNAMQGKRTPGTVMNSFSSYSISQSMKEDISRRKFSAISKSDLRKMSCASLNDGTGNRKLSTVSLMDSQNHRKMSSVSLMDSPCRRKMSTSFVIDPPVYGKFTTASLVETAVNRKYSAASLGDSRISESANARKLSGPSLDPRLNDSECARKFSAVSLGDSYSEADKPKMSYLSAGPAAIGTPPIGKRKPHDLPLGGFGNFSPIMADYMHNDSRDSDISADSIDMVSPSDHIQPHLRALGLKKSPFLSSSAKYVVNPIDAMKDEHYNEILQLLPEKYTSLYARDSISPPNDASQTYIQNQNLLNALDDTNGNTSFQLSTERTAKNVHGKKQSSRSPRQASQESDSSSSSSNGKQSNLDLFCTPTRRSHSDKHSRESYRVNDSAIIPSSGRGAYCSRAYSAIKCLFFRPTRDEMKHETNSISSDEDKDKTADKLDNKGSIDTEDNDICVEVLDEEDSRIGIACSSHA